MRANELAVADAAILRQAPAIVIIDVPGAERVTEMQAEIEGLRKTGELAEILRAMGVDLE